MKILNQHELNSLNAGRNLEYWICNAAFIQLGAWNALAFGIAGLTGAGIAAGIIIGVTAAAVCR
ncbi:hypothetical protein GF406_21355 [candidate division KSB1 bacterium]|nr:hypothetical protein [candidate division KSB1 bacterium]